MDTSDSRNERHATIHPPSHAAHIDAPGLARSRNMLRRSALRMVPITITMVVLLEVSEGPRSFEMVLCRPAANDVQDEQDATATVMPGGVA